MLQQLSSPLGMLVVVVMEPMPITVSLLRWRWIINDGI
jgi:hypothetical protein